MKKIYCFDLDKSFNSIKEASIYTGVDRTSINKACTNSRNTAGGMLWCYLTDKCVKLKMWRV